VTLEQASVLTNKMTSTPRDSTRKKPQSKDWRIRYLSEDDNVSPEALSILKCPFNTIPEPKDTVPTEFAERVKYLVGGQGQAPYTGYYATYNNVLISVSNVYSVWFEVHLRDNRFECFRLAQPELRLKNCPLLGLDLPLLDRTGEATRPPSWAEVVKEQSTQVQTAVPQTQLGSGIFTTEQLATMAAGCKETKRPLTPFDDPSDSEDEEPEDPFGSFKV